MTSQNLANLAKTSQLKSEPPSRKEFDGLVRSARARLKDAHIETLSIESRFDLGYNASHALALAALRTVPNRIMHVKKINFQKLHFLKFVLFLNCGADLN